MTRLNIPIGISDFSEIRQNNYYYIDKSALVSELLETAATKVTLITRPRRFGKTLAMSMLSSFFDITRNSRALFDGLEVSGDAEVCSSWMNQYPTVFLTFKNVDGLTFSSAYGQLKYEIADLYKRYDFLLSSERISEEEKRLFDQIRQRTAGEIEVRRSIQLILQLLSEYYNKPAILLLDEYDVPLAKASSQGYYDEMLEVIRSMMITALKDNPSLRFAIITGCLKIAKESIFTGLNNFNVLSITDVGFEEYFGFTDQEVREMLQYYGLSGQYDTVKEWYDGYRFGNMDVYCPWDVICYCGRLRLNPKAQPEAYWSNTSSNAVIRHFLEIARLTTKQEIERLISGESIVKAVRQELTYKEMYDSPDNIWSVLFTTGYLTRRGDAEGMKLRLAIPNKEIRMIFEEQISEWFQETARKDGEALNAFCEAFKNGDAKEAEKRFGGYLSRTISIRDTAVKKEMKENYYHGILLGLLSYKEDWYVVSNRESGDGYCDILVEIDGEETGIAIEVKYARNGDLEAGCRKALEQIDERRYTEFLTEDGMTKILKYGVACYKKKCRVMLG